MIIFNRKTRIRRRLLNILSIGDATGHQMCKASGLWSGTVYRHLFRLEDEKLIVNYIDTHRYHLTIEGAAVILREIRRRPSC